MRQLAVKFRHRAQGHRVLHTFSQVNIQFKQVPQHVLSVYCIWFSVLCLTLISNYELNINWVNIAGQADENRG